MKLFKILIMEISEKMKEKLLSKFSGQTDDSKEVILSNIESFERYKNGLPADKRDINRYSYEELKSLIGSKESKKNIEDIFDEFKKKEQKIDRVLLRKYIKKFLEIQSELPKDKQNILKYSFLNLVKLIDKFYDELITKKLTQKFLEENPQLTQDQLLFYIGTYLENYDTIPIETKGVDKMSFVELEHLLDSMNLGKGEDKTTEKDFSDIEMVYDENNLKIFAPKTKDQCIKLRNGRSWCTSREGGGNLYYNYRLNNERTLYYVIDEDKEFSDLDFAVVILVDPRGGAALADGSNSGRYSGHSNIPWDEIEKKIPKLKGLRDLFKPKPLTDEERKLISKVRSVGVGNNPIESFDSENELEMWLEYNSPRLSDIQYSNLSVNLKKKYIALGMNLSTGMIQSSEPEVLKYYISKKIQKIETSGLRELSLEDIALLNTPMMKKLKNDLKPKFGKALTSGDIKQKKLAIQNFDGDFGKFVALYGTDDLFDILPSDLTDIQIVNTKDDSIPIKISPSIGKFTKLKQLLLTNCVESLPDEICQLQELRFINLVNNVNLTQIPSCIAGLNKLIFLNLKGSTNVVVPESIKEKANLFGDEMWDFGK